MEKIERNRWIFVCVNLAIILIYFLLVRPALIAGAEGECGGIFDPYQQKPANCWATAVTDSAWMTTRSNGQWDFYKLQFRDRVIVDYVQDRRYLVKWYFSESRDPLVGWVEMEDILLDRDVRQ